MVRLRRETVNYLLVLLILVVLAASAIMLFWVERNYTRDMRSRTAAIRDTFARADVLKLPGDPRVNFQSIENLVAQNASSTNLIRQVFVVKRGRFGARDEDVLVYPFWYNALEPNWKRELPRLYPDCEHIKAGGQIAGLLYFELDKRALYGVRIAIGATVCLLVALLAMLAVRIFSQERVLTATTQILEENQRELIRMERLALAGLLSANIFHDIRKPITNIKHELDDLTEALGGFAGATRALRNMRDQVQLYFDILNDLNIERFVRSDQAGEEYVDVNRVVEQSLRLVHYERGATHLHLTLSSGIPLVLAHPYRLVQVFSNIVLNAYEALEGRGELKVATRFEPGSQGNGLVLVEICDNGPGIPTEDLERVFAPFHSTKTADKGTGLGLYICRTIVTQLGGDVRVESEPDQGARFIVALPAAD
jgi:signal transduction histidine kinase